jgi:hypothetical protein
VGVRAVDCAPFQREGGPMTEHTRGVDDC